MLRAKPPGTQRNPRAKMRRFLFTLLRLALGIGLLAYLIKAKIIDLGVLSRLVSDWPITLVAILLLLLDLVLMAWRLCCLFRPQGLYLKFVTSLQLTCLSCFFATFLPGRAGGDIAKVFYAAKENTGRRTEIVTVLLLDRAMGLFSLLLLPLLLAPFFPSLQGIEAVRILLLVVILLAAGMLTVFLLTLFSPALVERLAQGPMKFLPGKELVVRSIAAIGAYRRGWGTLAGALGISLVDNLMAIGVLALGLLAVHPASLDPRLCVMVPMGEIVNCLPITPGGLGVGETAFNALFNIVGLRGGAEALLCWRVWNALVGMLGLVFYLQGFRARFVDITPSPSPAASPIC